MRRQIANGERFTALSAEWIALGIGPRRLTLNWRANITQRCYAYSMGKQHDKHPFADHPFLEGLAGWMDTPAGELSSAVLDAVWALLEKVEVDAKQRKITWEDGQRLSMTESVQRIHAGLCSFRRFRTGEAV